MNTDRENISCEEVNEAEQAADFMTRPSDIRKSSSTYIYYIEDDEPVEDPEGEYQSEPFDMSFLSEIRLSFVPDDTQEYHSAENEPTPAQSNIPEAPVQTEERLSDAVGQTLSSLNGLNNKISKIFTVNTIISMFTLCVVAAGLFYSYAYLRSIDQFLDINIKRLDQLENDLLTGGNEENDVENDSFIEAANILNESDADTPGLSSEQSVDTEKGKLLIYDSTVGYSWVPILSGIKTNSYDKNGFTVDDNGRMSYKTGNEDSSYFGIDVSSYQGDIDWNAVREDGVEFAILRIGVRGYAEQGVMKADEYFEKNYAGAKDAGIDLGVYFYSQAISVEEAVEEAEFVLSLLDGRTLEYPVVFDWEPVDPSSADVPIRTEDVMPQTLTLSAIAFCETVKAAGYDAMIYTNKKMAYIKYDMRQLQNYPFWIASYNTELTYYYDFDIWQYGTGLVDGIEGDVDYNIALIR